MTTSLNALNSKSYNKICRWEINKANKSNVVNSINSHPNKAKILAYLTIFKYARKINDIPTQDSSLQDLLKCVPDDTNLLNEMMKLVKNRSYFIQRDLPDHFKQILSDFFLSQVSDFQAYLEILYTRTDNDKIIAFLKDNQINFPLINMTNTINLLNKQKNKVKILTYLTKIKYYQTKGNIAKINEYSKLLNEIAFPNELKIGLVEIIANQSNCGLKKNTLLNEPFKNFLNTLILSQSEQRKIYLNSLLKEEDSYEFIIFLKKEKIQFLTQIDKIISYINKHPYKARIFAHLFILYCTQQHGKIKQEKSERQAMLQRGLGEPYFQIGLIEICENEKHLKAILTVIQILFSIFISQKSIQELAKLIPHSIKSISKNSFTDDDKKKFIEVIFKSPLRQHCLNLLAKLKIDISSFVKINNFSFTPINNFLKEKI